MSSTTITRETKLDVCSRASTLYSGSDLSARQYEAFLAWAKGKNIARALKLKKASDALKIATRETTATREQKLAMSQLVATMKRDDKDKVWSRKVWALVAAHSDKNVGKTK